MFDSMLPISYYREIADLDREHGVSIVQHVETHKVYIRKVMQIYSLPVYEQLFYHPVKGIPRIYAMYAAPDHGPLTVIEEYISGDTLREVLKICGPLSEHDVLNCTDQLCGILTGLQTFSPPIVHRDIKPSNIILTEDGRIVLLDLNAARQNDLGNSRDTQLLGTAGFAAPEQYGFASSSPRADIYAVGILMKVLLTGDESGGSPLPSALSRRTRSIIERCTQMDPKNRYPSAAALRKALQRHRSDIQ